MAPDLHHLLPLVPGLLLHVVRTGAFFTAMPLFGTQADSMIYRLILGISLGMIYWWVADVRLAMPAGTLELATLALREVVVGLAAGFAVRSLITVVAVAGEVLSHEMGFTMSRIMNPVTGTSNTSMAQLFEVFAFLMVFQLNLHHEIIRVLGATFELVPVGAAWDSRVVFTHLQALLTDSIGLGLHYVLPVFAVLVLLTVTLMLLSRAVQNINLMEFAFGLRILMALLASVYFLSESTPFLARVFRSLLADARGLFVGA